MPVSQTDNILRDPETREFNLCQSSLVLALLLLVFCSNQWCRNILPYLYVGSIKEDTGLSREEYGVLVGYVFSVVYVSCGLLAGRLMDKYGNSRTLLALGGLIWSFSMVLMGLSTNSFGILASIIVMAIGSSFNSPAAFSLIANYFPREYLSTANGVWAMGIYIGASLGSFSILLDDLIGWRYTCFCAAGFGALLLIGLFFIDEPERGTLFHKLNLSDAQASRKMSFADSMSSLEVDLQITMQMHDDKYGDGFDVMPDSDYLLYDGENFQIVQKPSFCDGLREIINRPRVLMLFVASAFRFLAGTTTAAYMPQYFQTYHPAHINEFSLYNGISLIMGGLIGGYVGGRVADKWDHPHSRFLVPVIGSCLALPLFAASLLMDNFNIAMMCLCGHYVFAEGWLGSVLALLQQELPADMHGITSGVFSACIYILGALGPLILGFVSDGWLRYAMLTVVGSAFVIAILFLSIAPCCETSVNSRGFSQLASDQAADPSRPSRQNTSAN